jgi:putative pyruvate formate lyase activating enzyme
MRLSSRFRIDADGCVEVIDPGLEDLPLLQALQPGLRIDRAPRLSRRRPHVSRARLTAVGVANSAMATATDEALWKAHREWQAGNRTHHRRPATGEASLLDLKAELARRELRSCRLCSHNCGVNRTTGERGRCGLGMDATVAECFVHIGEEGPINPSLVISLAGCGLRCRYCQQWAILTPSAVAGRTLDRSLWTTIDATAARSLSFAGGNPDESVAAVLAFLADSHEQPLLPIVWNCHSYTSKVTLDLLDGVVDVYLADFKYGNDACGERLSGVASYMTVASAVIDGMLRQDVSVIVRLLVLPGHNECCSARILEGLASRASDRLLISVRDQYCPDFLISDRDGSLARRPSANEVRAVSEAVVTHRLSLLHSVSGRYASASPCGART